MKKFLMSIVAVLFAANSFAQYSSGGFTLSESTVYYGIRLGLNVSSITGDHTDAYSAKSGFNFGGVVGLRVSDTTPIFLESGLYYTERGANIDKIDGKVGLTYLEIPILIKYGVQVSDEIAVLPYIGPAFGLGIAGKTKPGSSSSFSNGFNRPDVGIKVGCGAEWNKLYLETGYQFGMANICDDDDDTMHGNAFFINLGVNF